MTLELTAGGDATTAPPGVDRELLRQAETLGPSSPPAGASIDGRPADQPAGQGTPAPIVDYQGDARELVEFLFEGVKPAYPMLEPIYTPEVRGRLADRAARVMQKYNLTLASIFAKWAPEIGLLMVTVPLIPPTIAVIREQRAADRKAAEQAARPHEHQLNPNTAPAST